MDMNFACDILATDNDCEQHELQATLCITGVPADAAEKLRFYIEAEGFLDSEYDLMDSCLSAKGIYGSIDSMAFGGPADEVADVTITFEKACEIMALDMDTVFEAL